MDDKILQILEQNKQGHSFSTVHAPLALGEAGQAMARHGKAFSCRCRINWWHARGTQHAVQCTQDQFAPHHPLDYPYIPQQYKMSKQTSGGCWQLTNECHSAGWDESVHHSHCAGEWACSPPNSSETLHLWPKEEHSTKGDKINWSDKTRTTAMAMTTRARCSQATCLTKLKHCSSKKDDEVI